MLSFGNDYSEGAHEKVLQRLVDTNMESMPGYCEDGYCSSAKDKIRAACGRPNADVFLLMGGTQTNQTAIDVLIRNNEGVIAASTGHIYTHEAGAIEFTGHKILEMKHTDGKISAATLKQYLVDFYANRNRVQMVYPGMVYISFPTEYGTLYTKQELRDISAVCAEYSLPLYIDGARMGYGLVSHSADVALKDIAALCDAFYIGGTKVGALCGEALVFTRINAPERFPTIMKQHGALLAKGRLLGVQFDTLFTDDLYLTISKNAIDTAERLKQIFRDKGYPFFIESPTNQMFVVMENKAMAALEKLVSFRFWEKYDENQTVVRFVTSWATRPEDVEKLAEIL